VENEEQPQLQIKDELKKQILYDYHDMVENVKAVN
jgi:chemotaxis methyl-accepting protein methylase